jgi:ribose transport system ATP-binding protein
MMELCGITKLFPGVVALDDVSISFEKGTVHALVGENGAGKSTLMKVITGIYQPDRGEIKLDGRSLSIRNFRDAVNNEINMVSQEIQAIPDFSIGENIVLDRLAQYRNRFGINWEKIDRTAEKYLTMVGLSVDPSTKIGKLTAAQKQLIQIAKAVSSNARYMLMDEPTSSLTKHETSYLFDIVRSLKKQGVCVIFISHKIEEVLEICDKVSVLRDGRYVGTLEKKEMFRENIVRMMIGRDGNERRLGRLDANDETVLEVRGLTTYGMFDKFSFSLKKGEILGFYGLVGSGRTELARQIIGLEKFNEGEVLVKGKPAHIVSLRNTLRNYRIGYVTENRKEEGLILSASICTNIAITIWHKIINLMRKINLSEERRMARKMIDALKIKTSSEVAITETMSGGNQQKVSIAKWLAAQCDILIIDEPTVGVDIGAKEFIHEVIWRLAHDEGKSIIIISSDMREIVRLAQRLLIFRDYKIVGEITNLDDERPFATVSAEIGEFLA